MKARIVERTSPNGRKEYVIQQRHFLFRWLWVDARVNSFFGAGASCSDSWRTLEEAKENLCFFDGTSFKDRVVS
jgi:hypothetical protein